MLYDSRAHETYHVIVDHREAQSETFRALKQVENVDVTLQHLEVGDYEVDGKLLFERKTLIDLVDSIKDGRLFRQVSRLASSSIRSAIILEGTANDLVTSGMRREALQGALITVTLLMGVPLLRSKEPRETAQLMIYAARQVRSVASGALPRKGKRPRGKRKSQLQLLQGLPAVGPERALRLLEAFGSVEAVISASLDELMKAPGIGSHTARAIRWVVSEEATGYKATGNDLVL